jgi:hypothetical protein
VISRSCNEMLATARTSVVRLTFAALEPESIRLSVAGRTVRANSVHFASSAQPETGEAEAEQR